MRPLGDEGDACHSKKCALAIVVIRRESLRSDHATEARRSVCAKRDHATDSFAKASRCLPLQVAFGANAPTTLPLEGSRTGDALPLHFTLRSRLTQTLLLHSLLRGRAPEMRYRFILPSGRV